ncbi:MAG: molybdopterin-binding protein [Tissierellia bacterium]|nr:molybdopterin-binding protein [Tissierellia bacterium]
MRKIATCDAVGQRIAHDLTRIVPGVTKGRQYKRGDIIRMEDVEMMLSMGKDHIYVLEAEDEGYIHENDAAMALAELCLNDGMSVSDIKEGKVEILADRPGFFRVDTNRLYGLNMLGEMMIATRKGNIPVDAGDRLAGMRIIPLMIEPEKLERAKVIAEGDPIFELLPLRPLNVGIVITGNEVFYGRVKEGFTVVLEKKLAAFDMQMIHHEICPDDLGVISSAIQRARDAGAELIICTGGMSVDPDDYTPIAIRGSGAKVVTYGAPILPGAMSMLGYFADGTAIIGLPAGALFMPITAFDIILPYVSAGVEMTQEDFANLGYGGFCLNCQECHYPNCQFGKGV